MKSHFHSYLLTFGHICTDISQGALPAMLPFLIMYYKLSYAEAAALVLASSMVSSVIQPLFGWLGDRLDRPWFMSVGIFMAGCGIALIGFVDDYRLMFVSASICGIGVALFHPEGGKLANVVAGSAKGAGISNFSVGGNIGFALGPIIATFALSVFGMHGTAVFLVPATLMAALLLSQTKAYTAFGKEEIERRKAIGQTEQHDDWAGFAKVTAVNFLRSIVGTGLTVFIPLYWVANLQQPRELASLMLTLYSGVGAVATFFGGRIADKVGFRRMIVLSFCAAGPLLLLFINAPNLILATALIMLVSLALSSAYSPIVALGQSYLPNRLGLASGISLGVVVSVGGITSPLIGMAGDHWGLTVSMSIICAVAFAAGAASFLVIRHRKAARSDSAPQRSDNSDK
ncbi:MAG: MFS transporter [Coriobacteriales bacterium]|jgi:FSR family fosmidomycin resistance protein-like MFS transporter|nr:MFS transporter [Coriobacteriales bacterium]